MKESRWQRGLVAVPVLALLGCATAPYTNRSQFIMLSESEDLQLGFARSRSLRSERARGVQQTTKDEVDESEHHRGASLGGAESAMLSDGAHTRYHDLSPSGSSRGGVDSPKG
jgi:hypothetical protein